MRVKQTRMWVSVLFFIIGLTGGAGLLTAEHPDADALKNIEAQLMAVETAMQDGEWQEAQTLAKKTNMAYMKVMPEVMEISMKHLDKKGHHQTMHVSA